MWFQQDGVIAYWENESINLLKKSLLVELGKKGEFNLTPGYVVCHHMTIIFKLSILIIDLKELIIYIYHSK